MEFKIRFRELRIEKGFSQEQVGKMLSMSKMAISHWERGNSEPSIEQLKTLATFFEVTVDYLVGFSDE